ncbi:TIR domain-containing protein [Cronobacter turicensis]|uniref:TIR domain-containing protein n=1 Tax=Cronobacter turicensis TaxID=413502 RepID=UPI00137556CE|nr:TIR domain-containing protein [Cronobacter turicensis]MEB8538624.1 TIR domain-containing protein [Cronobacter sakazakii]EKM0526239.1 TIR domain-containing protein [Cronobacter turicensis]ELQ5999221.1 TIR domain-containing protein [Cronobacter turicensis]ELQ6128518.1 TIR domain-containing protein [Cronobacter turicensis]ELY3552412.1 TIR domain-containing protein [Cronobacter turicensis]
MKIFLAHAKEDEKITESIYERLKSNGYEPWMDIKDIPGGVIWDYEIQKNFNNANVIIIILSKVSCNKNGYIRREINDAIEKLKYYKPDDVVIVPLLIDDAEVPSLISSKIQYIDYKRSDGWDILERSLNLAATQQNLEVTNGVTHGSFTFLSLTHKEDHNTIPSHELEITYPKISSQLFPESAEIISNYFSGRIASLVFDNRTSPWPHNFGWHEEYKSTYTSYYNEMYYIAYCNKNVISILHNVDWYGAGAAHPNSHFAVSNFVVTDNDYAYKFSLSELFIRGTHLDAIKKIKEKLMSDAPRVFWERTGQKPDDTSLAEMVKGILESRLDIFTIHDSGLTFHFRPYEIQCYALGSWELSISYYDVIDFLDRDGIYSLIK